MWNMGGVECRWLVISETWVSPRIRLGTRLTWLHPKKLMTSPYPTEKSLLRFSTKKTIRRCFPLNYHILKKIKLKEYMPKRTFLVCFGGILGGFVEIWSRHSRAITPLERPKRSDVWRRRVAEKDTIRYSPKFDHMVTSYHWFDVAGY